MALDFCGQNLRGRNFKGRKDLAGANFSYADIQGANFTNANLTGANFSHAKAGLQRRWVIGLVLVSFLFSGLSGFLWAVINHYFVSQIFGSKSDDQIAGWVALIILIAFLFITICQGITAGLGALAVALAVALAGAFALAGALAVAGTSAFTVVGAVAVAVALAFTVAVPLAFTVALAVALAFTVAGAVAGVGAVAIVVPLAVAVAVPLAGAGTLAGVLLSAYIAWQAMKGDEKYSLIRNTSVAFAAFGGTSFRNANLTDANFTAATLKSTDFRKAILTRTCFNKTKMLERVRTGKTYLQNAEVRKLLVTRVGEEKNFDYQDLRGINLEGANLTNTSFLGANLKRATFQGANLINTDFMIANLNEVNLKDTNLSRANLVQTQLFQTNFTDATLTGAYIQDWGITTDTKFDRVRCEYIYMRLPTKDNPEPHRKPDNRQEVFADGEFGDFIKPIFDTLDLYHNQGVDPRAIAIALKNLAENHPEAELEIVGMEKRGDDKILLRAKTAVDSDKSQLSAEYFDDYYRLKALSQSQQLLLVEKDSYISQLVTTIQVGLGQSKYHIQGNPIMSDISGINIQGSSNVSGIAGGSSVANLGTISGNVSIAINQLPDSPDTEKPGIKELLTQLQEAISQSTDLPDEEKAEALEQVKALAEAGKNPQESTKQKMAKTAITMLKGIFTGLPAVASLFEAGNKLLPAISKLFGLG